MKLRTCFVLPLSEGGHLDYVPVWLRPFHSATKIVKKVRFSTVRNIFRKKISLNLNVWLKSPRFTTLNLSCYIFFVFNVTLSRYQIKDKGGIYVNFVWIFILSGADTSSPGSSQWSAHICPGLISNQCNVEALGTRVQSNAMQCND